MSLKKLLAVGSVFIAAAAFAQAPLGKIGNVNGLVTVTDITGGTVTTVAKDSTITNGMRFVSTSTGSVTLELNNGCVVNLSPGQAVTVLQSMTCAELQAAVLPIGGGPIVAGAGGSFGTGLIAVTGLGLGTALVSRVALNNKSISGN